MYYQGFGRDAEHEFPLINLSIYAGSEVVVTRRDGILFRCKILTNTLALDEFGVWLLGGGGFLDFRDSYSKNGRYMYIEGLKHSKDIVKIVKVT